MAAKLDIFSNEWCDLIFETKNQVYGAYDHRRQSARRHTTALIIACVLFILGITGPSLIRSILPARREADTTVRTLAEIKIDKPKQENILKEIPPPPPPMRNTIKFTPPVIKPDEMVNEADEPKMQKEVVEEKAAIGTVNFDKGTDDVAAPIAKKNVEITEEVEQPFVIVEQMPQFPGGEKELLKFVHDNLKYPVVAQEMGVSGTVIVQFVVDREGKITRIKVMRGIGSGCDEEAIRVLNKMPLWSPGKQGGKPVLVSFTLPIVFRLN
jgi:periplasmic protein TonB